jgi:glutamyl-tRNA synthetase
LHWLGFDYNEGPYFQTKRLARYQEVIQQMLDQGSAYYCYCSKSELEQMREEQRMAGVKPRYDQRCRQLREAKPGVKPVVRFKNPNVGVVAWNDLVKGRIEIANNQLDDLIIARSDGTPTYNFCVVVDDWDMQITHVIRGDDHVNNTPRQINILGALGAEIPHYAHVPMILRADGQKMSKRNDPVSVMEYQALGILPQALLNYLARLCWGHGDDEIFSMEQFTQWFTLDNISPAAARFDLKKLYWVNAQQIKQAPLNYLQSLITPELTALGIEVAALDFEAIIELLRPRSDNLINLIQECTYFYRPQTIAAADEEKYLTQEAQLILKNFALQLNELKQWTLENIKSVIKEFCTFYQIKLPQLGMPLRLKLCGTTHTPAFDALVYILGRNKVLARLQA